jgi:hypothetical protein
MKKITEKERLELHYNDPEANRELPEHIAFKRGMSNGIYKGIIHERKKRTRYRAQGALFGSCLTGIIIIIITLII